MQIAILNPGPSLAGWPTETWGRYDVRIATNRAIHAATCEWWTFLDHQQVTMNPAPSHAPRVFTTAAAKSAIEYRGKLIDQYRPLLVETLAAEWMPKKPINWPLFSMTAAMGLAAWVGAKEIHLFGNDRSNASDWDGHRAEHDIRDAERWRREAAILDPLTDELARRGITVHRMILEK